MFDPTTHFSSTYQQKAPAFHYPGSPISSQTGERTVIFRTDHHQESMEDDDSGVFSPPLWKNDPSPPKSPSEPLLGSHSHRSLSPNSRVQAIVRGKYELMEMVKNMPESSYELTLKDLVENQHQTKTTTNATSPKDERKDPILQKRGTGVKVKRHESHRKIDNNNRGLFLNMVFPVSFKSNRKKGFASSNSGKVSPKPEIVKGVAERDWWKKRFTGSSDSNSSRTSNNSGSSGGSSCRSNGDTRRRNGFLSSCWTCFSRKRL